MPGTCLSSNFWASTLQNKAISNEHKGHLASSYHHMAAPITHIWEAFWSQPKPGEMAPPSLAVFSIAGLLSHGINVWYPPWN